MGRGRVTLVKPDQENLRITVELTVTLSSEPRIKSHLNDISQNVVRLDSSDIAPRAVEAACMSGSSFGLSKIVGNPVEKYDYAITIESAIGILENADLTPCAIAAFAAVAYITNHPEVVTKDLLEGWEVVDFISIA